MKTNSLNKYERLKSKKIIAELFRNGNSVFVYPIKLVYHYNPYEGFPMLFSCSVSKRNYKKAVDRNQIKRHIREAYRINKDDLLNYTTQHNIYLSLMYIYVGKSIDDTTKLMQSIPKINRMLLEQIQKDKFIV